MLQLNKQKFIQPDLKHDINMKLITFLKKSACVIFTIQSLLILTLPCHAGQHREKWYVDNYCKQQFKGFPEYHLPNGKSIDCLTDEYAMEFGFPYNHYEDIGQALYYAHKSGKKPGIVFVVSGKDDIETINEIRDVCDKHGIKIWTVPE